MDKFPEAYNRFEQKEEIDYSKIDDSNQLMKKFAYWQNRPISPKQRMAIRHIAEKKGIKIIKYKPKVKFRPLKKDTFYRRGKKITVYRIPKGQKGAGRFAKRT